MHRFLYLEIHSLSLFRFSHITLENHTGEVEAAETGNPHGSSNWLVPFLFCYSPLVERCIAARLTMQKSGL